MKVKNKIFCLLLALICSFAFYSTNSVYAEDNVIYLGGMSAGFSINVRGAYVAGICDVLTKDGLISPAKKCDIQVGDSIMYIDDYEINSAFDIEKALVKDGAKKIVVLRKEQEMILMVLPVKDVNGKNKLGVFVRDEVNGIGTITCIKNDRFASLGHPIINEQGQILNVINGEIYTCNITGYVRGERGKPGELRGVFSKNTSIGVIDKNLTCGVYGKLNKNFDKKNLISVSSANATMGNATIYTTINGKEPKEYSISILKVDNSLENKNLVVKITDKELLDTTGGIVQGMSGSPILQNGKIVGAITHVFINDPTHGFGISFDNIKI